MSITLSRQQRRANEADQAVEGDRRFFARHPSRTYRVRLLSRAEQAQLETLHGGEFSFTPEAPVAFAVLKQLAPGTRVKAVVFGPREAIGEELTEAEARSVFESCADRHPQVRQHERMMVDAMRQPGGPLHQRGAA